MKSKHPPANSQTDHVTTDKAAKLELAKSEE